MRSISFSLLVFVFLLGGCVAPEMSLNSRLRAALGPVDGVVLIPQSGLDVTVTQIDGGTGGVPGVLVAAAIDEMRQTAAQRSAAPILQALRTYDFRRVMLAALADDLGRVHRLRLRAPWTLSIVDSESHRRGLFDASSASAVLFCRVNYRLESGNLLVTAIAEMFPKATDLAGFRPRPNDANPIAEGNALYRKTFTFTAQNVIAETVAGALTEGAGNIAFQVLSDLDRDF